MIIHAITCSKCHDVIYSRARHDLRHCSCKSVFIDGGLDYVRVGWDHNECSKGPKTKTIEVDVTKKQLYNDWNKRINNYGLIKQNSLG